MKRTFFSLIGAIVLIASLGLTACDGQLVQAQTGTIEVRVTDAPPDYEVKSIMVTIGEGGIKIHRAGDDEAGQNQETNNGEGQSQELDQDDGGTWITIPVSGENPFDLVLLQDQELLLATLGVQAGKYTQIRMDIDSVVVTYRMAGDTGDTTVEAEMPSGKLKFVRPFEVIEGATTAIVLDFIAEESVVITGSHKDGPKVIVKPVVKLTVQQGEKEHQSVSVDGTITGVDIDAETVSFLPAGETEPILLNASPNNIDITLDGEPATLEGLAGLGAGNSATVTYYTNNLKVVSINAESPPV